jgi:hypothetical protein
MMDSSAFGPHGRMMRIPLIGALLDQGQALVCSDRSGEFIFVAGFSINAFASTP